MIRPLYERLIISRKVAEEVTKGGIIIPDESREKPFEGEVVAAGKGMLGSDGKCIPMDVKVGDNVLFSRFAGTEIEVDGKEYLILSEQEVLGVL
jgi:chaperonin GroES